MRSLKRQAGYGSLLIMALVGILALGSTVYYKTRMQQPESVRETYESTAEELREISSALTAYYRDNMAWPATINDLAAGGYFTGDAARCGGGGAFQSPFCTVIFGGQTGDDYTLTVNLLKESVAQAVANQIPGGTSAGTTVTATINRPFQSALYDDYLQRVADPDNPQRTQLEVDLDINNNDLVNIGSLNVQRATFDNAEFTNADIDRINTEEVQLGNNSITYAGNQLNVNAGTVRTNGSLSMNGDIVGNGNDITGIDSVSANTGQFDYVSADSAAINSLSGNSLDYNSGSIDSVSGNRLTFGNGSITALGGNTFTYGSGTISSVSGNILDFNSGNIGSLSGNSLSYGSGTVNTLSGNTLTYGTVSGTNGNFDSVSANSGSIGNMSVTGTAGLNRLSSSNGNVTNLDVTTGNINSGEANSASGTSVSSSGTSTFSELDSNRIDTNSFKGQTVQASSGSTSGNASAGSVSASNLTVNNRLQTNVIESNSSSVGNASASKLTVLGALSASGINVTTANFNTGSIASVSGTSANYNTVTGNQFNGGSFTSNDDFYTSQSSVNNNHLLITEQRSKLDNCVDVTKYCIPQTPSVNLTCSSCNSAAARSSFSGTATGSISGCRQGCSYSWVTSGSGLSFSGCSGGTIAKGGSASPSCRVSSSLGPQESASGSIQLIVTNSHYTSRTASDSVNVSYTNTTPNDPFRSVTAGCYVDTAAFDQARPNSCMANGWPDKTYKAILSVGEYLGIENYQFYTTSDWTIAWSGDCTSSQWQCVMSFTPGTGDQNYSSTVSVRHKATGETRNFSVTVRFHTLE
ncbi:hypothetical protein PSH47_15835 [Pseudoalteromonas sp. CST5]|uniref:beta strand repeat-containing protein n=1 Tax=unclassified Pseudoalteromonas TaxID=194690 RepID=UPI00235839D2|nr:MULTISPECIES: hypothetical protein [unclassified Pseudoalteromonas]MDC9514465.1 hypothetical protein [Pseudoalteromonas sp. CST1]MDC9538911.1 hypothetical protein [Pseudoalteromonas sp. CST3]MDC9543062.1 hypothetical protein [Pseudoalteromonas sp. CST2]MDC9545880.1 hypothetical protein [Pseudoalteromonas sp. CST4]MDC9550604.1 hypothetical protein [Pseudoalteromonas sp. CST5]